jgi:asparagine synthase (glutamine-hydrolysing)
VGTAVPENGHAFTAFCLAGTGVPLLGAVGRSSGSFLALDGRLIDREDTLDDVLDAWLADGDAAFMRFRFLGIIAAWNPRTARCVIVRGPHGSTPGYITKTEHGALFSTDQTTLVDQGIDRAPNIEAIDAFLATGNFAAPMTPLRAISKVPPQHLVAITPEGVAAPELWFKPGIPSKVPASDAVEVWRDTMTTAIQRLWPEQGDVGTLLSGGIDSGVILAIATKELGYPCRAFTFQYEEYEGVQNEVNPAAAVAAQLDTPHEVIPIGPSDLMRDLDGAVAAYDEPLTWGFHSYRLNPVAERGITSVFTGLGADQTIAARYKAALRFNRLPAVIRGSIRIGVRAARPLHWDRQHAAEWVSRGPSSIGLQMSNDSPLREQTRRGLYHDPTIIDRSARNLVEILSAAAADVAPVSEAGALRYLEARFTSAEAYQQWNRSFTLAAGLEICMPFYDPDVLAVGMNIDDGTPGKEVSRKVAGSYLSDEMAHAPRLAQQMPVSHWLRGPLTIQARERLSDLPHSMTQVFDPNGVLKVLDDHVQGRADHGWLIVGLLTTASWFDQLGS